MPVQDLVKSDVPSARRFTPQTPFHDPHLDPNVPKENLHMVPQALFAGRNLNRELPRPATANLHVMLKLTNDPKELQKEFQDKLPQINDVLKLWGEAKGANSPTTSEAQLRSQASTAEEQDWTSITTEESKGTTFNLVSRLDTPGRADVIYLADASEDSGERAGDSCIPSNLRTSEWSGFDGSYVHLEDAEPKIDLDERSTRRNSTPSNVRIAEWLDDEQYDNFSNEASSSKSESDAGSREAGPYQSFWSNHH